MGDSRNTRNASDNTHREIMLAGAFAAFTVDLLVYPLDTIKTRIQSRDYIKTYATSSRPATAAWRHAAPSAYALRGLYQGVGSVILATLPAAGVFFTTYEWAKRIVGRALPAVTASGAPPPPAALVHALSSGMAELASCLVLTPAEVIKQNAQMIQRGSKKHHSPRRGPTSTSTSLQALQMLMHAEGGAARRLLAGYTALVARNLPFTAMQFPMFEALRTRLFKRWSNHGDHSLPLIGAANGLSAGTSGAIAAVITTPTDVVKTRMMLSAPTTSDGSGSTSASTTAQSKNYPGALQLTRLIYREHGVRGLFRGGAFRAGWTFIGSGLYLGTYEVAKAWLRDGHDAKEEEG